MKLSDSEVAILNGLCLLVEVDSNLGNIDQCYTYCRRKKDHPFGLSIPQPFPGMGGLDIMFVGGYATDFTVKVFLTFIRFCVGSTEETRVKKLRVITVPYPDGKTGQHHVFFEIQTSCQVIISGETTDFSSAGNEARNDLESVLAVLSTIYKVEVDRVEPIIRPTLHSLYNE